ncbi:MAG: hypothetical protein V5A23_10150 [Halobacteriales archaeon]
MSSDQRERPPSAGIVAALPMARNGAVALVVGVGVGSLVYLVRMLEVLGPAPPGGSPLLFLGLAIVLAATVAGLVFSVLTAASAYRVLASGADDGRD